MSQIIQPDPDMDTTPILDLRFTHSVAQVGDIMVITTWNRHTAAGCIVLLPAHYRGERPIPCIVDESSAWKWSDSIGDILHQEEVATLFAANLGLPPSLRSIHRVMSIIRERLDDLIHIPPMPEDGEKHLAEAFARNVETGEIIHKEIRAHV